MSSALIPNLDPSLSAYEDDTTMLVDGSDEDELLSATSGEEASKVFEQWQDETNDVLMINDEEETLVASISDDIFYDSSCLSPSGPLEELVCLSFEECELDRFSLFLWDGVSADDDEMVTDDSTQSFEERYKATLQKLAESMEKSQETRKSLKMKTTKTETYPRDLSNVLSSIEKSSQQLQSYLHKVQRI